MEGEIFLVAKIHPEMQFGKRQIAFVVVLRRTAGVATRGPVAHIALKIQIMCSLVANVGSGDQMHEQLVGAFDDIAGADNWLRRLLGNCYRRLDEYETKKTNG
ncbi:MAG: hypothetical protein FJZ47_20315 [Candidatus Tectomicrobia bacterium]|uniref:Uncharacterized protein n=1 Tax=Tectimicrobiota bacterium TaxID=2528274 RepID=A0A937W637_UNCTE|nr:hypothetical protein [Candidatus Tectomicrobia bacterium]